MSQTIGFIRRNHAWLLVVITLALFATKTLFNYPLAIMAVLGVVQLIRRPRQIWCLRNPAVACMTAIVLCFWIPMLLSLPDAVHLQDAARFAFTEVCFLFPGLWAINALRDPVTRQRVEAGFFWVYTFWGFDALLQFFAGRDVFGYPYNGGLLTGMFYPKAVMGLVMGTLLPLYYESIRRRTRFHPAVLALVLVSWAAVLLSENRTSWFMAALGSLGYVVYWLRVASVRKVRWPILAALSIAGIVVLGAFSTEYGPLRQRIEVTAELFSGNYKAIDEATSHRLSLWRTAINIYEANWLNGIGPRGYRYAYRQYADKDDWWIRRGDSGQTHPHQTTLEIAAETGTIGLAGYVLFWLVLFRYYRRKDVARAEIPWAIAIMVAMFPLNAHMEFYGSYWASLYWWLICIGLGMSRAPDASAAGTPMS